MINNDLKVIDGMSIETVRKLKGENLMIYSNNKNDLFR
jgi:hypothetical protein